MCEDSKIQGTMPYTKTAKFKRQCRIRRQQNLKDNAVYEEKPRVHHLRLISSNQLPCGENTTNRHNRTD